MTTQSIKSEWQPVLDGLNADKQELLKQREELIQAQNTLLRHGIDDLAVYFKIREIEEKVNRIIDDEQLIKQDINRQVNFQNTMARKNKEQQAFDAGIDAYHNSITDGSMVAVCPYRAKYLKRQWKKGYNHMCSIHGSLGGTQYAS